MMLWLAHFANWSFTDLMEASASDILYWYEEAVKLHRKLTPPPK